MGDAHATYPRGARLVHFSDNHDQTRAVLQFGLKGALAASVLNFTLEACHSFTTGRISLTAGPRPGVEVGGRRMAKSRAGYDPMSIKRLGGRTGDVGMFPLPPE